MDGFISIERFQSLTKPDKLLSLQLWRDDACLAAWRNLEAHRAAQRRPQAEAPRSATTGCASPR